MIARDELAARCYLALLTPTSATSPVESWDYGTLATLGVKAADALLSALAVPPAAALTEAERVDLADAIRQSRAGNASIRPWERLDTYDQKAALDRADAAAAWFAKRDGTVKP